MGLFDRESIGGTIEGVARVAQGIFDLFRDKPEPRVITVPAPPRAPAPFPTGRPAADLPPITGTRVSGRSAIDDLILGRARTAPGPTVATATTGGDMAIGPILSGAGRVLGQVGAGIALGEAIEGVLEPSPVGMPTGVLPGGAPSMMTMAAGGACLTPTPMRMGAARMLPANRIDTVGADGRLHTYYRGVPDRVRIVGAGVQVRASGGRRRPRCR